MSIELTDDGTMDTVLRCTDCGEEMRYNYDNGPEDVRVEYRQGEPGGYWHIFTDGELFDGVGYTAESAAEDGYNEACYQQFIEDSLEDAEMQHDCPCSLNCDQCEMLSINGMACHETGCPNARKAWDHDLCAWVDTETSDDEQDVEGWISEGDE